VDDLVAAWAALGPGPVIAPSHDGGTSLVAGHTRFPFTYGPGSFHRHVAAATAVSASPAAIVVRPGLALDLDTAEDLAVAGTLPAGAWIAGTLRRGARSPVTARSEAAG
jgi:2-phospho-L-lactate guanylyltransferase (CobY/MobA/RfbA family)